MGISPNTDTVIVIVAFIIASVLSYPFWARPVKRGIRWWKREVDKVNTDMVDSERDERFRPK